MIDKFLGFLDRNWSKWHDVDVIESLGTIILIQCRKNYRTGKKQFRKEKIHINGDFKQNDFINKINF